MKISNFSFCNFHSIIFLFFYQMVFVQIKYSKAQHIQVLHERNGTFFGVVFVLKRKGERVFGVPSVRSNGCTVWVCEPHAITVPPVARDTLALLQSTNFTTVAQAAHNFSSLKKLFHGIVFAFFSFFFSFAPNHDCDPLWPMRLKTNVFSFIRVVPEAFFCCLDI